MQGNKPIVLMRLRSALGLYGNQFSGTIPSMLSSLSRLVYLSMGGNYVNGTIPATVTALTDLEYVTCTV